MDQQQHSAGLSKRAWSAVRDAAGEVWRLLFWREYWNVGVIDSPVHSLLEDRTPSIRWLDPPAKGTYRADPFAIRRGDECFILYEQFDDLSYTGSVWGARLENHGGDTPPTLRDARRALELPGHAAYPYLLEHEGEIYCIPETAVAREVALFRAVEPPHRWEKAAVLIKNAAAVDATVFEYGGRWWLFHTDFDADCNRDLFVWYAASLLGPWQPHEGNPVKSDAGSARPAGRPFVHEGRLYRPAQDCLGAYGRRVVINHVTKLDTAEFAEHPAAYVEPDAAGPYADGLHTICGAGDITLVDGKRYRFIGAAVVGKIRKTFRRKSV